MHTDFVIEFDRVTKKFPKSPRPSVVDCSFQVRKGEFVVILGTSGSGKTTLLKMVNRLYTPSSGEIRVDGVSIDSVHPVRLRRNIGYVIQQIGLYPHMTVEKNIATVPKILGWEREKIRERVKSLLNLVHLPPTEYATRYPRQLSGGQQQRVGIARALAGDPAILLMDEPFGAIDAITRATLQREIKHIQKTLNKTLLFVTHDVDEALRLADKIIVMEKGRIIQFATPLEILTKPANAFVGELIGANDILQRLAFIPLRSAMDPVETEDDCQQIGKVPIEGTLKDALAEMIRSGISEIQVVGEGDVLVGKVTLDSFSRVGM